MWLLDMKPTISVRGLGKSYRIQSGERKPYRTLRDDLVDFGKGLLKGQWGRSSTEEFWAIRDIDFDIYPGEVVGIIGRNGAGKSTLLKILSRIIQPTTGEAILKGRVASLLEVGTGFHPELTGRENIYISGAILGMTKAEIKQKFDEIIAFAEVERFLDIPVKRYSSGMYVRLAFAVAAHLEAEILIIDEVLAVGDAQFQRKCLGKMEEVGKYGKTVIIVSHIMPTIQALCERAILLQNGSICIDSSPAAVIPSYLASETKDFETEEVNLNKHLGRIHSQEPALKKIWIVNSDGIKTRSLAMGSSLEVHIHFNCTRAIRNPGFGFGVEDKYGNRIFSLNNYMVPTRKNSLSLIHSGVFNLKIPSIPLMPGTYFVTPSLVEDQSEWVDCVKQAISFEVHPFDVFGSGKIPESTQGYIYLDGEVDFYEDY
jgi:lipopolysaccharide transport system ATP-binding protein